MQAHKASQPPRQAIPFRCYVLFNRSCVNLIGVPLVDLLLRLQRQNQHNRTVVAHPYRVFVQNVRVVHAHRRRTGWTSYCRALNALHSLYYWYHRSTRLRSPCGGVDTWRRRHSCCPCLRRRCGRRLKHVSATQEVVESHALVVGSVADYILVPEGELPLSICSERMSVSTTVLTT
jgi:hypothetical protein